MQKLKIKNEISNLDLVAETIEELGEEYSLSTKIIFEINLAVDELLTNIIKYAYAEPDTNYIEISIEISEDNIKIIFSDTGIEFDPLSVDEPDLNLSIDKKPIGGLGIHFVKQKVDEINYKRINNKNILSITKRIK